MQQGTIRIIAGKWRGRKLTVLDHHGLRPTPSRVRETLFNWLMQYIAGARCLDVFAGSGALGFEALSRGAAFVQMVDANTEVVTHLRTEANKLQAEHLEIKLGKAPSGLHKTNQPYDIIFLDPPYQSDLLISTFHHLETQGFLKAEALIYMEADREIQDNELPKNIRIIKSAQAGQVFYYLAQREMA